ncbi:MAG: hypothetical protein ABS62_04465 [Microbacterium sp. SCN 70-200]|uniref:DUF6807 domain-containing protein n=1 Tax=unclassified Microbacterium TaxID=2609290 RepID=UPI00086D67F5|nr:MULTISPECIES: PmoA family protein [unclassified Microbacterium]MBN9215466.1 PmoA family protein [Microbacterium sp.]ODT42017.1 MAG: hypothetical protein ABS62_04465 [Microbacterium sp. SCN 70-200]OJV79502.1 MAG: hypothetical protein BGO46_04115 [Microbacterium sp. 70-16]
MQLDDTVPGRLVVRDGGTALLEYVYAPTEPQVESPRPYALLRTRAGVAVTAYRPADHVWHKGLSLALPAVGPHNFWGGPTYVRGEGYVQLPNNGAQVHRAFTRCAPGGIDETLDWTAQGGATVLAEQRSLTVRAVSDTAWALTWRSALTNISQAPLAFGSPTTKGRPDAGYAGIFWRGPAGFTGGEILGAGGAAGAGSAGGALGVGGVAGAGVATDAGGPTHPVGDAARGEPAPWLAFVAPDRTAGILMMDATDAPTPAGNPWFARSAEYAGLNPAPFFHREAVLAPGATMVLAAALIIGDADVSSYAPSFGAELVAELRSSEASA